MNKAPISDYSMKREEIDGEISESVHLNIYFEIDKEKLLTNRAINRKIWKVIL